jgi:hypothetical protein
MSIELLHVEVSRDIAQPADVLRRQFMDIAHHIRQGVHPGLIFKVHSQSASETLYSLEQRVCGWRLFDEYRSSITPSASVLGEVLSGSNAGMRTEIFFTPLDANNTHTRVHLSTPVRGIVKWIKPVYAWAVRRSLAQALAQDAQDVEAGNYPSAA